MALIVVDQLLLGLGAVGKAACGVGSEMTDMQSHAIQIPHTPAQIMKKIGTTSITGWLGSTPGNIADYLIKRGANVQYTKHNVQHSPIVEVLAAGLAMSNAARLTYANLPAPNPGGPPFYIHCLKISGLNPCGHFIVGDGTGTFMDPGSNPAAIVNHLPTWANFYDTGLTLIAS
jgi:hypothetical protein